MYNYLYLIQDSIDIGSDIYKIGKTTQAPSERLKGYSKGTYLIRISKVDDCHSREIQLINLFKTKYKLSRGREYFIGNINQMLLDFSNFCDNIIKSAFLIDQPILSKIVNNYTCNICEATYPNKRSLDIHINRKNKCNIQTRFQCTNCKKYFKQNKNLNEHIIKQICNNNEHHNHKPTNNIKNNITNGDYTELAIKYILNSNIETDSKIYLLKEHNIKLNYNSLELILNKPISIDEKFLNIILFLDK